MSQIDRKKDHVPLGTRAPATGSTTVDPVCGMTMTLKTDTPTETLDGKSFHFCSEKCRAKFKTDPSSYASGDPVPPDKAAPANAQYTCPMHPEIIRDAPGACPLCGMALEPTEPTGRPNHELIDFTRRMWISVAAAVPLLVLTMGPMAGAQSPWATRR